MFPALLFYIFSLSIIASALMVIFSKQPINSVLFLIFSFINASGLFLLAGAEFLALIIVIVYVGAVAVLFLFVIMMLDFNPDNIKEETKKYLPIGLMVGGVLFFEIILMMYSPELFSKDFQIIGRIVETDLTNTEILGNLIYTEYFLQFQMAGFILLVAMIGAIVLTLRHRDYVRRQVISDQISRDSSTSIELIDINLKTRESKK
ncbi:NADH-quinone oxidoreductase subunit J [Hyphomicrobiales bacterium]|jgi:NADH-quinone oxidoreductase subunit J|nr:NADH-quinone oxidoreductase subunit J [Hyphomicrobiales bacterium]MDB9925865.1 NADH-quinone oxidoreductase subunit J [Hyphomicrobiales bacterium]|tara:strand:- start:14183 stop:14797 length:615 start_codon:yes stop_codon:yes gene_type:complete